MGMDHKTSVGQTDKEGDVTLVLRVKKKISRGDLRLAVIKMFL